MCRSWLHSVRRADSSASEAGAADVVASRILRSSQFPDRRPCAVQPPIHVRFDWELARWGLVMRTTFPGGHIGPNRYPHCKVSDSGHLCFWDTKLAVWVPMFRLTDAQLFEWMKSIKVLDMELR